MANKKSKELSELETLDNKQDVKKHDREDMREITKSSIKKRTLSFNVLTRTESYLLY